MTLDDQLPLPTLDVPKQRAPKVRTPPPSGSGVRWVAYRPLNPARCDDCVTLLAVTPTAPRVRQARYRRVSATGDLLLCASHMEDRRIADGLKPLKEK